MKVVMVMAGHFKSCGLPRQMNLGDQFFIDQQIQVSVNRGQIQVGH